VKKILAFVLVGLLPTLLPAQNTIGLPDIINYFKENYKSGAQNRQVRQDKKGRLYFANNDGLLTFNGKSWNTYPLPNKTIIRSLEFGPDKKLYVGGQDEFGYFSPAPNGHLVFNSLKYLIPVKDRSFADVWKIIFLGDDIFFQTTDKIFHLSGKNCAVYTSTHWLFIAQQNNRLIAQDAIKGLLAFNNGTWSSFLQKSDLPKEYFATSIAVIGKDSSLLTTMDDGLYILTKNEVTKLTSPFLLTIEDKNISCATMVNDKDIAIATNLAGCFIIDKQGNLVQSFSRKEGLQNNNVLDVFLDKEKNLWLGLDNGIDFIAYNNAIKHIYSDYLNEGSGYTASIFNNQLYIGTSTGLYKVPLSNTTDLSFVKGYFQQVNNTKGQVWNLSEVNGQLLMGHNEGSFVIADNTALPLYKNTGFWTFQPFYNILPSSLMVAGTYQGIEFFNYSNNKFQRTGIELPFESARYVVIDNGNIWVAHPYKGIYRIHLRDNKPVLKKYTAKDGLTSDNANFIFKVKNRIILTTDHGLFEYNAARDTFEPSDYYNKLFPSKSLRYLKEDNNGNTWFVFDKILGVIDNSTSTPQLIYFPELTDKFVSGFEFIYAVNNNNVFVGGEKGFYHINYEQYKKIKYPLQVQLTLVKAFNERDSLLFGGYDSEVNDGATNMSLGNTRISHAWNSFHFSFAAPVYAQQANIQYSFLLEGFDEKWSEFSQKTEKEYTNLSAGNYIFKVKARNNLGNESEVRSYYFTVLPPWYQTIWMYMVYAALAVFAGYRLYRYQKKKFKAQQARHEEEQKQLQYLYQLELEKTEKELVKLRNEKLEAEIRHKNTELASTAMHLVQKGELLGKVKDQMLKLKQTADTDTSDVKKILRTISDEDKMDEQWEHFSIHFDKVHSDFLLTLKNKYPLITNNEMKLSAYLRMNLSTKEIAQLMNISVRGVEISRYRLRKKLEVPKEENLFDFLLQATQA
jgi:ligand-binding sensor domain-containing protein/DNA-binding CsgD family transcriptional regulator